MTTIETSTQKTSPARRAVHPLSGYPPPEGIPASLGKTLVGTMDHSKLIGTGKGYMQSYDYVINPYAGCSFGCSYCYASNFRTSDAQKEEWGNWVQIKESAVRQMSELKPGSLNGRTLYMATATDPYQPIERITEITRQLLELMAANHPRILLVIQTRSPLVTRDTEIFQKLAENGAGIQVNMTISTDEDQVRRLYEPGCPSIEARAKAVAHLNAHGVQTCVTLTPLLPMKEPADFVQRLMNSGTSRFILQPFRYQPNETKSFIARTDRRALESAKEHYQTDDPEVAIRFYHADYLRSYRAIRNHLESHPEIYLGFDRDGFKPPFEKPQGRAAKAVQPAMQI